MQLKERLQNMIVCVKRGEVVRLEERLRNSWTKYSEHLFFINKLLYFLVKIFCV